MRQRLIRFAAVLARLFARRRRPAPLHAELEGTRWTGIWAGMPHRPLRPEDDESDRVPPDRGSRRRWLDRGSRERY